VSFSPALKWFIALLLPLTLVWKLTLKTEDSIQLKDGITKFLVVHNFVVSDTKQQLNGMPVIHAAAKNCDMLVLRASPDGWTRDLIRKFASATGHIFIVFRGKIYTDQSSWTIMAGYLQSKILHRLGLVPRVRAVIAVVASEDCDAERLPWDRLRDF
jgi:hypothetical protein